jgi:hypothetical protein
METREKTKHAAIDKLLHALPTMSVGELCRRYREIFGKEPRCLHRQLLVHQIAWKISEGADSWTALFACASEIHPAE